MARQGPMSVAALLTGLVALGALSTDMYLPALPQMTDTFNASISDVQLTLSLFLIVFSVSQLIYGPLSDRFGRRPVIMVGMSFYAVGSLTCMMAQSIEMLWLARALQAFGACCGPVVGRAVVRDRYDKARAAQVLAYMASAMAMVPAAAPIAGGWVIFFADWRAIFAIMTGIGTVLLVLVIYILPETNKYRGQTSIHPVTLIRGYISFFADRPFRRYMLINGFLFSGMFAFISGSSFVLIDVIGVSQSHFGFCFAAVVFGYISGAQITGRLAVKKGHETMINWGLWVSLIGGVTVALVSLTGFVHVVTLIAPISLYFCGCGLVLSNAMAGAVSPYPTRAGAASAMLGAVQTGSASLAGAIVGMLLDGTSLPMAGMIGLCSMVPFIGWRLLAPRKCD